jgi:putative spermidine/putrescine transport system permease protein
LLGFVTIPTVVVMVASFNATAILSFPPQGWSVRWYVNALTYPDFLRGFGNSLVVTGASAMLAVVVGGAAVMALERTPVRGAAAITTALMSPLIVPGVVAGLGLLFLGAAVGLLASRASLIVAHVLVVMPFVMRSIWVSLKNLDPTLELAAAGLGASPGRVLAEVTLPLMRPGIFAALLFALVISFNEFVVSLFVSTRVTEILPVAMFNYIRNYTDPTIAALSSLFIVATTGLVLLADRLLRISTVLQIEGDREARGP